MSTWSEHDLNTIAGTQEIQLATQRADGTRGSYVTIWAVRQGENLYVRSALGRDAAWFRRALANGKGHLRTNDIERDVVLEPADDQLIQRLDAAYRQKYSGLPGITMVTAEQATAAALRVVPTP